MCRLVQQDRGEITCNGLEHTQDGICPEGRIPTLCEANREVWGLFTAMLPGLLRMEGYDFNAIRVVFDMYGIEKSRRAGLFTRITKIINVLDTERRARRESK